MSNADFLCVGKHLRWAHRHFGCCCCLFGRVNDVIRLMQRRSPGSSSFVRTHTHTSKPNNYTASARICACMRRCLRDLAHTRFMVMQMWRHRTPPAVIAIVATALEQPNVTPRKTTHPNHRHRLDALDIQIRATTESHTHTHRQTQNMCELAGI